jgi:hypothetical protein
MKQSSGPRKTANLSGSIHQQLNMYALAATAGGVSLLALVLPSEAKIVYTPTHIHITPNHTIPLDLNHDGKKDFLFRNVLSTTSVGSFRSDRLSILPQNGNEIWGYTTGAGGHYASALVAGVRVGPRPSYPPVARGIRIACRRSPAASFGRHKLGTENHLHHRNKTASHCPRLSPHSLTCRRYR